MVFAAKRSDIANFGKKLVSVGGVEILLINIKGTFYACENECPHQGSPMQAGIVKDPATISCPRHGYRFDLITGACADFSQYTLKTFPVEVVGDDIMVELGS